MIYELINPSDATTFVAGDLKIAALVTFLVGGGGYSAEPEDDKAAGVPMFLFGGAEEWWNKTFPGEPMGEAVEANREEVVIALRSVCYGNATSRRLYDRAMAAITDEEKRVAFVAEWNDANRSSLNNIMGRAHSIADGIEEKARVAA
jgi:hypothetical protein